jgi:hypothetical protein
MRRINDNLVERQKSKDGSQKSENRSNKLYMVKVFSLQTSLD